MCNSVRLRCVPCFPCFAGPAISLSRPRAHIAFEPNTSNRIPAITKFGSPQNGTQTSNPRPRGLGSSLCRGVGVTRPRTLPISLFFRTNLVLNAARQQQRFQPTNAIPWEEVLGMLRISPKLGVPTIMENQMERKMKWKLGLCRGL